MCAVVFIFFQKMWKQQKSAWNIGCVLIKVIMSIKQATTTKNFVVSFISGFNTQCAAGAMFGIFAKL